MKGAMGMTKAKRVVAGVVVATAFGCGSAEDTRNQEEVERQEVTLTFEAQVGEEAFACGESYEGLGVTGTTFEPFDFRMFVSAVELRGADGEWSAMEFEQDGMWQVENVALLDFEDGSGRCQNGTSETRGVVTGTTELEEVTGVRFEIGVPFGLNHQDAATAPSPLNATAMFWSWLGGYKFVRLEGATTGLETGWQFHLGSTNCEAGEGPGAQSCGNENRVMVEFEEFDVASDVVVFDVAELVKEADMDAFTEETPRGCMAGVNDPDCGPLFSALGLMHGGVEGSGSDFAQRKTQ